MPVDWTPAPWLRGSYGHSVKAVKTGHSVKAAKISRKVALWVQIDGRPHSMTLLTPSVARKLRDQLNEALGERATGKVGDG